MDSRTTVKHNQNLYSRRREHDTEKSDRQARQTKVPMKTGTMPETVTIDTDKKVQETEELAEKRKGICGCEH